MVEREAVGVFSRTMSYHSLKLLAFLIQCKVCGVCNMYHISGLIIVISCYSVSNFNCAPCLETKHRLHAQEIAHSLDLRKYDGIVSVSGDGVLVEVTKI